MAKHAVTLGDRYDLGVSPVLLNGTQALVRLMLMQAARDRAAGHRTAGYVTGYRGSPLGAVDMQMERAKDALATADVLFQPGLNEDLAATALWGTQGAGIRGTGRTDGVFGLWYGKGPGVDRSGDALRHANLAGTAALGGVIAALGDDHTGESSTTCHQSDLACVDAAIPLLSPAGVQEIVDFGLYAYGMSRFSGLWAGLKLMKDTVEVTAVIEADAGRMPLVIPAFEMPPGGVNIRPGDSWVPQEARLWEAKIPAALAFARANGIDRRVHGRPGARIGVIAAGKNWLDVVHALALLGIDGPVAGQVGLTTYKLGQTWPVEPDGLRDWAEGLELIVVVEEKRKLIEGQVKELLYGRAEAPQVWGAQDGAGRVLFPVAGSVGPVDVARVLGRVLSERGRGTEAIAALRADLEEGARAENAPELAARLPYFCAGCPHNTSTKVPDGMRAGAGIGCHTMVLWMDRNTEGYTHMGAEGANWIGEAPFSTTRHVLQNMGDGTYNHSGNMAIRAAIASGVTMTYKILFNDAVALTGGQGNDGGLTADRICRELLAMGAARVAMVHDPKEGLDLAAFPAGIDIAERDALPQVQRKLSAIGGVTAIVYVQTCAAEKRRRRRVGTFPVESKRVWIDPEICEGCGDCGVQSNCVAILPLETELGRKRQIDQSGCNRDFACIDGFCPSFLTIEGGTPRKAVAAALALPDLPDPVLPAIDGTFNIVITGIGGTGVVTIGAVLAMAAHLEGKGAGMMEISGLSQKGGAVQIHCRIGERPRDISAIRVAPGECDALIGGDLVVSAGDRTMPLLRHGRTRGVVNTHDVPTGAFTRAPGFQLPIEAMEQALAARLGDRFAALDATALATARLGEAIYANMVVLGAAWQAGAVPLGRAAIAEAIRLNGADVSRNLGAFDLGRWALLHPAETTLKEVSKSLTVREKEDFRTDRLRLCRGGRVAARYRRALAEIEDADLRLIVMDAYYKLLSYKDEYEVARLLAQTPDRVAESFEGDVRLTYHLAPPILARHGPDGRPRKRAFGGWTRRLWPMLARLRFLRGTPFDPFGYAAERRAERGLIARYEADLAQWLPRAGTADIADLLRWPLIVRGFGPVKSDSISRALDARRRALVALGQEAEGATTLAA